MSQKALSMRKIKEVLRLRYDLGLLQNEIARSCSIGQASVHRYLERASAAGLSWPLPEDCDDRRLNELLFPTAPAGGSPAVRGPVDFAVIHHQLQSNKYVTLQLLWEEYRQSQPEGYRYSRFCELYRRWHRKQDVVLRQEHRAGEKMFVDWAGATIPIYDRETGAAQPASLFVAVLGASSYAFARATLSQDLSNWIECHVLAFEFFQGTSKLIVPDNPRTGVTRACRYEPDLNRTYLEMAQFYGVAIMPARPYKARDKAKVEAAVLLSERWVIAVLRHDKFFSLADLNQAIAKLLERMNQRPFRKREGSRASLYAALDQPALQPLPAERYVMAEWKTVRVNIDYHIEVDRHYYSVPYALVGEQLEARFTAHTVEIFHRGKRVASHVRAHAQEPSGSSGVDPLTVDSLGRERGRGHGPSHSHDPEQQTASGDGLSRLSGHSPAGQDLFQPSAGSGLPTRSPSTGLFLSQSEVDPETRPGRTTHPGAGTGAL